MTNSGTEAMEAKFGTKMIEVKLRFWTDQISEEEDKILPKRAWAAGVVRIARNDSHGIVPGKPVPFNSLLEIGTAIEKVLLNHGITLHPSTRMDKYVAPRPRHAKPKTRWSS